MKNVLKILSAVCMFFLLQGSGCSTHIEKLEMNYKEDFSGSTKATINVHEREIDGKKSFPQDELDELYKTASACDVNLREVYGYNKKFTAEYKFSSYEELRKAPECSKMTNEHVIFHPLEVKDGFLTKDVTLKMTLWPIEGGSFEIGSSKIPYGQFPDELIINVPGKIQNVSFIYAEFSSRGWLDLSLPVSFIIDEKSNNSYEITNNKVVFKIDENYNREKNQSDSDNKKFKARCASLASKSELERCYTREMDLILANFIRQYEKKTGKKFIKPEIQLSITTRINKLFK